jgi:hypothetical protein
MQQHMAFLTRRRRKSHHGHFSSPSTAEARNVRHSSPFYFFTYMIGPTIEICSHTLQLQSFVLSGIGLFCSVHRVILEVDMPSPKAVVIKVRCFNCAREIEMTSTDKHEAVYISYNLYYCHSCAEKAGHPGRRSARAV